MRTTDTPRPAHWPPVDVLRKAIDDLVKAKGFKSRTEALRRVDLSQTTFERVLREGLSEDGRKSVEKKLDAMGVLAIIPRR